MLSLCTQVLVEERGPPVTRRAFPWIRSAGRKGQLCRNRCAGSVALRLVNTANTCSLSFDLVFPGRMERYREVVSAPPGRLFKRGSASPEKLPICVTWLVSYGPVSANARTRRHRLGHAQRGKGRAVSARLSHRYCRSYRRACREIRRRTASLQRARALGRSDCHPFHAHGYRPTVLRFA